MFTLVPVSTGITAHSAQTALAFPPIRGAYVGPTAGKALSIGWQRIDEFDLSISVAGGSETFSALKLHRGQLADFTYADDTFTIANATEIVTNASHALNTGDGPFRLSNSGGALPAGLASDVDYWFIKIDANTGYFASSLANALAGTPVAVSGDGTGTHTIADIPDRTKTIDWHTLGLLGPARDGALILTAATEKYVVRALHSPLAIAYALSATLTSSRATTVKIFPISERP